MFGKILAELVDDFIAVLDIRVFPLGHRHIPEMTTADVLVPELRPELFQFLQEPVVVIHKLEFPQLGRPPLKRNQNLSGPLHQFTNSLIH
jgi:hypothetical protein